MNSRSIGIMANLGKTGLEDLVGKICHWFLSRGINITAQPDLAERLGCGIRAASLEEMVRGIECLLVIGGDGTILNSARAAAASGVPVLGINLGHLGFLSEIDLPDLQSGLESVVNRDYHIEERMMIEASVLRGGEEVGKSMGLNDAVITKGAFARLIFLETRVDGEPVGTYPADGIIVSTPTGSTAYSLSAGGPVVTPDLDLMLITPICPHALWARPIVISPDCLVEVELMSDKGEVMLTIDGQHGLELVKNDVVRVARAPFKVRFIRLKTRNFFRVLKQKLREGNSR
ncbi:MAG: NAD(+)/NADH kinase [Peptococcaceae bacterium]|nr:NAD(+)/NADH kinase [Peptococcaceae bacterium]